MFELFFVVVCFWFFGWARLRCWFGGAGGNGRKVGAVVGYEKVFVTFLLEAERAFCHVVGNGLIVIGRETLVA
jgi:hypothetical protein